MAGDVNGILQTVERWADLYNENVIDMVDKVYADDFFVECPGIPPIRDKATFHEIERVILAAVPDRRLEINRTVAAGDTVAVEVTLTWTDPETGKSRALPWCAVLDIEHGRIVRDHSYIDPTAWPGLPRDGTAEPG